MLYNFRLFKKDKIFQGISKNQNEVKVIPYSNRTKVLSVRSMRVLIRLIRAAWVLNTVSLEDSSSLINCYHLYRPVMDFNAIKEAFLYKKNLTKNIS